MHYDIYGPFELPLAKPGRLARLPADRREFWDELEEEYSGLAGACGCYLVSVRNRIWYVGMAGKQEFRRECFTPDKILKINDAMDQGSGRAFLTLIARQTNGGRFSKPSGNGYRDVRDLELLLIGAALERNPALLNKGATKVLREMVVPGFINSPTHAGNRSSVKAFWRIMGM